MKECTSIIKVRQALEEEGYETIIIVDASLRYKVDDRDQLESLIVSREVLQAPAGTDADYFVLETASRYDAADVSNDRFEPYQETHLWIKERRVSYMFVEGHLQLYKPKLDEQD